MKCNFKTLAVTALVCLVAAVGCENEEEVNVDVVRLDTPTNVAFDTESIYANVLTLTWDAVKYVSSYTVKYWEEGKESSASELSTRNTTYALTDLNAMTTYYAQVKAVSPYGSAYDSDWSEIATCSTNNEQRAAPVNVTVYDATSSTITFEWDVDGSKDEATQYDAYDVELYKDADCTDLLVSWRNISTSSMFTHNKYIYFRFTFAGLDPGTTYYVKVMSSGNALIYSEPCEGATTTFDYTPVTSNAQVGDVILAEDFARVTYGGDIVRYAVAVTAPSLWPSYFTPFEGENPTTLGAVAHFGTDAFLFQQGSASYIEDIGLSEWADYSTTSSGHGVSTRPGYVRVASNGNHATFYTPVLSMIPEGQVARVKLEMLMQPQKEAADIEPTPTMCVGVHEGGTRDSEGRLSGGTEMSSSVVKLDFEEGKFTKYEVELSDLNSNSRIFFKSNPDISADDNMRFMLDDVVVTIAEIYNPSSLSAPTNVAFDEDEIYEDHLTLTWDAVSGASSYVVKYWSEGNEASAEEVTTEATTATLAGLEPLTTYYAQVKACSSVGSEYDSEYSDAVSCATNGEEWTPIVISLVNASSSTITVEWVETDFSTTNSRSAYTVALYKDEACSNLVVSWDSNKDYYTHNSYQFFRFTFAGLDAGTTYYAKVWATNDTGTYSNALEAATTTFGYTVSSNTTAQVGDVLVAEDFSKLIHGGDLVYRAGSITGTGSLRITYTPYNVGQANPTTLGTLAHFGTDYDLFTGSTSDDYVAALGLDDWAERLYNSGTSSVATKPGYVRMGASNYPGGIYTPVLSTIPDGKTATVEVRMSVQPQCENSTNYNNDAIIKTLLVGAYENVTVDSYKVSDSGVGTEVAQEIVNLKQPFEYDKFVDYTVTLKGVTSKSRIFFGPDPDGKTDGANSTARFSLDNVVVTVTAIDD